MCMHVCVCVCLDVCDGRQGFYYTHAVKGGAVESYISLEVKLNAGFNVQAIGKGNGDRYLQVKRFASKEKE